MVHVYEFEVVMGEKCLMAFPYDMEGATQGKDMAELAEMAVDWLRLDIEMRDMHDEGFPTPTFGNKPRYGGTNMLVAVDAGKHTMPKVNSARAAELLGVTPARVSQMMKAALLDGYREGGTLWVTMYSIEARLKERPKAGRPKKNKQLAQLNKPVRPADELPFVMEA